MEADIISGKFRKPVSLVASSTPCIGSYATVRPLLAKFNRLNTDQLSIALRAIAPAEEEKIKKTNDEIRPCNTERHHRNSNVTNASTDRHSYLLFNLRLRLRCFNAEQLSIALRAVAQAEKEKKMKKKKNNIHLQPRNTEQCHGNSSVTNASANCQPTVPCLQPRLRADAPPWSPPANDDGSLFPIESDSYREYRTRDRHCLLTAAEGGPIDDQADNWELINSSEISSLPLTAQERIDYFAPFTHEQCDRVDWIGAIVLAYADVSAMFMKYESFFLTILTGMDGIPTDPILYRQKYTDAFLELQQFLPDLKLRNCRSWETNPALANVIHDLQQLGAVSHYGDSDTAQSSLSSSDIRVPIPSDEMTIPTGTEASEPPNYQVDAHPSVHHTIISEDAPIAPPTDLQTTDANPSASQPVISHQADEIDAPILRTVTYEDDEFINEPNPCKRAGTSDALPYPTQARNTITDNAEDHIAQFIQSMEMTLDDELNEFLQITSDICTTLDGRSRIQATQCTTDPECELNDCNMPTAELLLQLSQPAFTPHHPTYKPDDPLDPGPPGTEPPHHRLHNFPAGLAEDIMSFSRHSLRPAFANNTHHHVSTGSLPICPVSEPTGSSLQDHGGDNDNESHGPRARNHRRNIRRRLKRKAARLSRQQVGTSREDNAQNFARSSSKPQDSHGPRAKNHRRKICRRNKRKAAHMSSQAQKKTHAMSSGRPIIGSSFSQRRQASLLGWEYTTQDTQHSYLKRKSTHTFGMNSTTMGKFRSEEDSCDVFWGSR
ncbi:hypothetical protein THAOC_00255 [Thalassiosira oceanica]|uniref:Uncharacterized protein n=1 Tax=Thalassiosira oceanica TaxID=159749 RepID=K0TPF1_THAOC|nr:hypothetical protein THAOC_00255 [Thalassiosira oceanica]|eukprot:EJK77881.1 hypothetical protein THAOC_00255 [Thalassiosira oceanica]